MTEKNYCDFHIHTNFSDGQYSLIQVLKMCEKEHLSAIAIADHDSIKSCQMLEKINLNKYFSGDVVFGCEFRCVCENFPIEILGYGFDYKKLAPQLNKFKVTLLKDDKIKTKLLYNRLRALNSDFNFNINELDYKKEWCYKKLYEEALKNRKLQKLIKDESLSSSIMCFLRQGMCNPNSKFFCDMTKFYISATNLISIIHDCGGIAVVAHPMEYGDNYTEILNNLVREVDGIECYHPSSEGKEDVLLNFAKKNNKFITGGSDFHGNKGKLNSQKIIFEDCEKFIKTILHHEPKTL